MIAAPTLGELKKVLTWYHLTSFLLTASFYISKTVGPICRYVYRGQVHCYLELTEYEILLFLAVIVVIKNRRATSWLHYLSNFFTFSKLANLVLFYRVEPAYAIGYAVLMLVQIILFPEPAFSGKETVVYFRGPGLHIELERDKRITWLVEFYASWSPDCTQVQHVFAELSNKYTLSNLKFAKLDVGRFTEEAQRFRINAHPTSRQLPTLALFQNGKETVRRPLVDRYGRAIRYTFSEMNVVSDFNLNNLYQELKQTAPRTDVVNQSTEKKKQ